MGALRPEAVIAQAAILAGGIATAAAAWRLPPARDRQLFVAACALGSAASSSPADQSMRSAIRCSPRSPTSSARPVHVTVSIDAQRSFSTTPFAT